MLQAGGACFSRTGKTKLTTTRVIANGSEHADAILFNNTNKTVARFICIYANTFRVGVQPLDDLAAKLLYETG